LSNGAKKWKKEIARVVHESIILTDGGAFDRPVIGVVEGGCRKSMFDALCNGNEGVADLDIAHALKDELLKGTK
jgi:hypothetical protein